MQQIVLLDAPAVVGWTCWRSIDDQHTLGGTKVALRRLAAAGRLPEGSADVAQLVVAAVGEAVLLIARAPEPAAALAAGERVVEILQDRLVTPRPQVGGG